MDVTCFKCGKNIHANDATRALAGHLRASHTAAGLVENLVCGQHGCKKTFTVMNSFLRHIRRKHLNENLHVPVVNQHPPDEPMHNDAGNASEDDQDEEEENYAETFSIDNLKQLALSMIMKLKSTAAVSYTAIEHVMCGTKVMFQDTLAALKHNMLHVMQMHEVDITSDDVQDLCTKFSSFENPYLGIETPKQQVNYMIDNLMLVPPVEIALGTRIDQAVDRTTGEYVPKVVTETFQYIPVINVLKLVLKPGVQDLIDREKTLPPGYLRGYRDGHQYQQHGIFKTHPNALRLQLFYDDVEVANPIGSKTGIHKLGLFYYSIQNLPFNLNSSMNSIFVLAVCYTSDIKKYGFQPILDPFIKEMEQLESDSGVELDLDGRACKVHGTLVSYSADTLAAHELLGFLSPSANLLCRLCKATREGIQIHFEEDDFEQREIDDHDDSVEAVALRRNGDPETGVRTFCPLNSLQNFHCVTNYNFDVMHDMLEGVCPYEVKLLLNQFIFSEQFFTLPELNQRLRSFHYSFTDKKNKPSALASDRLRKPADHKLGQKAAQMWCLVRMLPFLIGDRIPQNNNHYSLLLLLLQCMDIIYAPLVSISQTVYLKYLISEHHALFKMLFPESRMINKHHHMVHYPTCMRMSGPMVTMQCLKYELKHGFSKRVASVNCNFKNICKSVACKHQVLQCTAWSGDEMRADIQCLEGCVTAVESVEGSEVVMEFLQLEEGSEVFAASKISLFGTTYKQNLFLASVVENDIPQFSKVSSILVCGQASDELYFVLQKYQTKGFVAHFHAFEIAELDVPEFSVMTPSQLLDHLPLSGLRTYEQNSPVYLCPRYSLTRIQY